MIFLQNVEIMLNICCLLKVLYFSVLIKIINNSTKNKQMDTQHFIQIECIPIPPSTISPLETSP